MKVSVVIITKNQKDLLKQSLPILLKQSFNGRYEIIVVDSGSTDGAVEYVKNQKVSLVQIPPKSFNYAFAFNSGAKIAKSNFLVRLSGDVIPLKKNFLTEMVFPFTDEKVGVVYGCYTISGREGYDFPNYWSEKRFPDELAEYSIKPNLIKYFFDPKHREIVTNLAGGCCSVRKNIWEKHPFNEKLSAAEDAEYALYLHLAGYNIVCNPKAIVLHEHEISRKTKVFNSFFSKWVWQLNFEVLKLFFRQKKLNKFR